MKLISFNPAHKHLFSEDFIKGFDEGAKRQYEADVSPKGKWIRITQGADPEKYMCPFCHRTVEDYGPEGFVSIRYPYCHCGADMREVE